MSKRPGIETISCDIVDGNLSDHLFFIVGKNTPTEQAVKKIGLVKLLSPSQFPYSKIHVMNEDKYHDTNTLANLLCRLSNEAWKHVYLDEDTRLPGHRLPFLTIDHNFPTGYTKIDRIPDDIENNLREAFVALSLRETIQATSSYRLKSDRDLVRFANIVSYGKANIVSIDAYHNLPEWLLGDVTVNPAIEDGLMETEKTIVACSKIWKDVFTDRSVPTNYAYDAKTGIFDLDAYKQKGDELGVSSYIDAFFEGVPLGDLFVSS